MKTILVTAALLAFSAPALAQTKLALPDGNWGDLDDTPGASPVCLPAPFLAIKGNMITITLDGGQGRCKVKSLMNKSKNRINGKFDCKWDKSIPSEQLMSGDQDENAFSIEAKSNSKILYNNVLLGKCPEAKGTN